MTRRRRLLAVLAVAVLSVTSCANVPLETKPQAISEKGPVESDDGIERPEKDLSASDIVRDFVEQSGRAADNYAASRQYLDPAASERWRPGKSVVILQNDFNTIPVSLDEQPSDANQTRIRLHGKKVGELAPDKSFIPGSGAYERTLLLRRQPESKQWRIVEPPGEIITTEPQFKLNYFPVPLYFFAPGSNARVPDPRYLEAEPRNGLPARVVETLLEGPSMALAKAVDNPLQNATLDTNVTDEPDGALEIPLTGIANEDNVTKKRIVAQMVMALEFIVTNRIRLLSDGKPVVGDRKDWRPGDLQSYDVTPTGSTGMAVQNGRLVSLENGRPVAGPAGAGAYRVVSAAQSLEGQQLALVEKVGDEMRLRIGLLGRPADLLDIRGSRLTRPTWQPAYAGNKVSYEVWTVVDGKRVIRALLTQDDTWSAQRVDAKALSGFGKITALRLSRDGTRAAVIAGGKLVVASVARTPEVKLRAPRILQEEELTDVIDVDWHEQDSLVVATKSSSRPVASVSVDGFTLERFNPANLETPVTAVTAIADGPIIAQNDSGLWTAPDSREIWKQHRHSHTTLSSPFYPG